MGTPKTDEAAIRATIRALKNAGYTLDSVFDGEPYDPGPGIDDYGHQIVRLEDEAIKAITAVDDAYLHVDHKTLPSGWIRFVMGNSPEEVICDHTINLSHVIDPLIERWD